jgi:hypothetical protein
MEHIMGILGWLDQMVMFLAELERLQNPEINKLTQKYNIIIQRSNMIAPPPKVDTVVQAPAPVLREVSATPKKIKNQIELPMPCLWEESLCCPLLIEKTGPINKKASPSSRYIFRRELGWSKKKVDLNVVCHTCRTHKTEKTEPKT